MSHDLDRGLGTTRESSRSSEGPVSGSDASAPAKEIAAESNDELLRLRVQEVLDEQINPAVAMHGGTISLVDVKGGRALVHMGGGCQGCGMAAMTLAAGVEALLLEEVPELKEVVDVTNHAAGERPYFPTSSAAD